MWFLTGSHDEAPVQRRCVVPSGKPIFVPLIGVMRAAFEPCGQEGDFPLEKDEFENLLLTVNGGAVAGDLQQYNVGLTRCDAAPAPMPAGLSFKPQPGLIGKFSTGVFVALRPLPPGEHVVKFGAAQDSFSNDITYTLVVE